MNLATRIRRIRTSAKLTQAQLAEKMGVHRSAVAQWEHGERSRPTIENLSKLAVVCHVRFDWLATGRGTIRADAGDEPAAMVSEFAHDILESRMLAALRNLPRRKRESILEIAEALLR